MNKKKIIGIIIGVVIVVAVCLATILISKQAQLNQYGKMYLEFLENHLYVHCGEGTPCGKLPAGIDIHLTDQQAIWIDGDNYEIIE